MGDYHRNVPPSSPQPLKLSLQPINVQDILRQVEEAAQECNPYLFPFRRIRCRSKSAAERRQITEARIQLYERSGGACELALSPQCWRTITFLTMHMHHVTTRARGARWDLANLLAICPACHDAQHNANGKPCPPKAGGAL
jgi:5-methylcytosine-specific restriction endonuclease McrA